MLVDPLTIAARVAVACWQGDESSLRYVGGRIGSVFRVSIRGVDHALRVTPDQFRTMSAIEAECDFVEHLSRNGIQVAAPVRTLSGNWVHAVQHQSAHLYASVTRWLHGLKPPASPTEWHRAFLRDWGRSLGELHSAAVPFAPVESRRRWQWIDDIWFRSADTLFEEGDGEIRDAFRELLGALATQPLDSGNSGLIHGDHWPDNFLYDADTGIAHFDFENCRYHWFVAELIAPLSMLRRLDPIAARQKSEWLLEGYTDRFALDPDIWRIRSKLFQLQDFYTYLSRLYLFPRPRSEEQQDILQRLRQQALVSPDIPC